MTAVRRILILLVGLALLIDGAALAYIKLNSGPKPSDEKSKLVMWIDDPAKAKAAAELLKEQGYDPLVKPDKRKTEVEADFRVAMSSTKKELLTPIEKVLRQGGHKQISYSEDGTKMYYGGFYKEKSQALKVSKRLKAELKLVFEVVPGVKVQAKNSNKVILLEAPSNMVDSILEEVGTKAEIADHSETSLAPKEEEAGDEPAEESASSEGEEE